MVSKGAAGAALPPGDPQPKSKSESKSSSKSKSEPKPSHDNGGEKKPTSNTNPRRSEPRKPSSEIPKSPSKPPNAAMASDRSPDAGKPHRKRKAGDGEPFATSSKTSNEGAGAGPGSEKACSSDSKAIYQEDCITILLAAIEFRNQTGAAPTNSQIPKFYKSVEGSLHSDLSEKQVWNRLRTLRFNLKNAAANGHRADPVHKLSMELWPSNNDEKQERKKEKEKKDAEGGMKQKKAKKRDEEKEEDGKKSLPRANDGRSAVVEDHDEDMNEEEEEAEKKGNEVKEEKPRPDADKTVAKEQLPNELQAYPYLARATFGNWKKHGFPDDVLLSGLKVDPEKAKILEDKWKKCISEDMRFQIEWAKVNREIRELMYQEHKKI